MSRHRRRSAFASAAFTAEPTAKADGISAQAILGAVAVGATKMPGLDWYWFLYQKCVWVASCVNIIAKQVSSDGFDVIAKDGKKDAAAVAKDERVGQIGEFFDSAFVGKITFRRAMMALAIDLEVFGLGYWRKKRAGKLIVGLERLDPRLVIPKPNDDRTEIDSFLVRKLRADEGEINSIVGADLFRDAEPVSPNDIIFFTLGGGDQLLGAPSPLEHLDHTLGLDLSIRRYRQSFFANGATTGKIIGMKGASRDQVRATENMIKNTRSGPDNAYKTWVIATGQNGDITVADRGDAAGQKDIDFIKGSGLNRDEVCAIYHVPPGKLLFSGNALGSSGKAEDDATFKENCVLPLEEAIYEILNRDLLVAELEIEDLELAPKGRSMLRLDMFPTAESGLQFGMTINEARNVANLPPITDEKYNCDVPIVLGARGQGLMADEPVDQEGATPEDQGLEQTNDDLEGAPKNQPGAKKPGGRKSAAKGKAISRSWY